MKYYSNYTNTEENYLKAIYKLSEISNDGISTNAIAARLDTKAASVTDMLKKLDKKKLISYKKYQGVTLTQEGERIAILIIRKHRLWEYFLVQKLNFKWDEVHEVAEQLEHIKSKLLVDKLAEYLGNPKYDPHGDPIPNVEGKIRNLHTTTALQLKKGETGVVVGVKDHSTSFLQHLDALGVALGKKILVKDSIKYDQSLLVDLDKHTDITLSKKVSENLFIERELK